MTGSVLRSGDHVRITAQLIDAGTEECLWAGRYERHLRDVLSLQNDIVAGIVREIQLQLSPRERAELVRARPVNPDAYEAYLKGRFHWYQLTRDHHDKALQYFESARQKDPSCALAYAGIAATWLSRGDTGIIPPLEALSRGKEAITRALALDDTLAEVHEISGNLRFVHEWDWGGAERDFLRAIDLNPNYADAHAFYSDFLFSLRRFDEANDQEHRALELDPLSSFHRCFQGWHLLYQRRTAEALERLEAVLASEPQFPAVYQGLWGARFQQGRYDDAIREARRFFAVLGDTEIEQALVAGNDEASYRSVMRNAADVLRRRSERSHVPALRIARLYAHAADTDAALAWLERAYERREPPLVHLAVGWDWDGLGSDARFAALLARIGLPH